MQSCSDLAYSNEIISAFDNKGYAVKKFKRREELTEWLSDIGRITNVSDIKVNPDSRALLCSNQAMPFHTDHPDANVIAWYCVAQSSNGGASLLVDSREIISALDERSLTALKKVQVSIPAIRKGETGEQRSLLSAAGVYYANWLLGEIKDYQQKRALTEFMILVANAPKIKIRLQPGQALIINNNRMLHGREAFQKSLKERYLIRYWVATKTFRRER